MNINGLGIYLTILGNHVATTVFCFDTARLTPNQTTLYISLQTFSKQVLHLADVLNLTIRK
ncbi:hypothetical protein Hanom_Chr06g00515821 [Helianthus anomalus]